MSDNMLNQTTEMNYASRKNPSSVKTLLQKCVLKNVSRVVFLPKIVFRKTAVCIPGVGKQKHLRHVIYIVRKSMT